MYYNGQSNGIRVHHFLNMVHEDMVSRYKTNKIQDSDSALLLQVFFQDLKSVASGGFANTFDEEILNIILTNIQQNGTIMSSSFLVKNIFSGRGGTRFERELASVIEAVWNEVSLEDFDIDKVLIGAQTTNIAISPEGLSHEANKILQKLGAKTQTRVQENSNKSRLKKYYIPSVAGKIDVKGYEVQIRANADPRMIQIYNLLKNATFSAKNYDSMSWDEKLQDFVQATGHATLALGKSNIYRAIYATLSDFGYDTKTIESAIMAGFNSINNGNNDVANHFYHMRYMYELTGSGIFYGDTNLGAVKYLIYNDPHGGIYVKSSAEIMSDVLKEVLSNNQSWKSQITIPKSKFIT